MKLAIFTTFRLPRPWPLIGLYLHTKFRSNQKKNFVGGWTDIETSFIRSTRRSWPKRNLYFVHYHSRWISLTNQCSSGNKKQQSLRHCESLPTQWAVYTRHNNKQQTSCTVHSLPHSSTARHNHVHNITLRVERNSSDFREWSGSCSWHRALCLAERPSSGRSLHRVSVHWILQHTRHTGQQQTCNKVEELCHTTLLLNKVACLTSRVAQLLKCRATNLLDRNHLYSLAISCFVVNCLFTYPRISVMLCNIHPTPLLERYAL